MKIIVRSGTYVIIKRNECADEAAGLAKSEYLFSLVVAPALQSVAKFGRGVGCSITPDGARTWQVVGAFVSSSRLEWGGERVQNKSGSEFN